MTLVITYRATNQKNGKWYVGSTTTSFERRKREHLNSTTNLPFHNALRRDPGAFTWEILDESEEDVVTRSHEQYVLDGWWGTEYCYNINPHANGMTSEQASESAKKQWEDEHFSSMMRNVVSESNKKRWEDPDYRAFMSEAVKSKWEDPEYWEMQSELSKRMWEDEGFRNMMVETTRKSTTERWKDPEYASSFSNALELTNIETGETMRFKSVREANRVTGLSRQAITNLLSGYTQVLKGYSGKYLDKKEALELY